MHDWIKIAKLNPFPAHDEYISSTFDASPAHNDKYLSSQITLCAHMDENPFSERVKTTVIKNYANSQAIASMTKSKNNGSFTKRPLK